MMTGRDRAIFAAGAVEGNLAAAPVYTLVALLLQTIERPITKIFGTFFMILDFAFVGSFVGVAVLTSPKHHTAINLRHYEGTEGAYSCMGSLKLLHRLSEFNYCTLLWSPFILGILSTWVFYMCRGSVN